MVGDAFKALGDPTRRRILELLSDGDMTAGQIADNFQMSKPSVSNHLGVLKAAGL
ncbi:MAG: metalloregulator ArsR/SmtB family transcription factor, partial [Coriobacteriales bacterium]